MKEILEKAIRSNIVTTTKNYILIDNIIMLLKNKTILIIIKKTLKAKIII
jgi:hypothetical protein